MSEAEFRLRSLAFDEGEAVPVRFTCDGEDVSPALKWEGVPPDATSLALVVDDPDADGFVHWLVYNMDASRTGALAEGASASPDAPPQGRNDFRRVGWSGPCPPPGRPHRYRFRLLALDGPLELGGAPDGPGLLAALEGHVIDSAIATATYERRRR